MDLQKNKALYLLLFFIACFRQMEAQNGIHQDAEHSFLIPMLENNVMMGHANVYQLDKVSKDSNSFMLQVYDELLRDVGEKRFTISSKFTFDAAVFNGKEIVTKFVNKQESIRYMVFDQKATLVFDTTLFVKLRKVNDENSDETFRETPIFAVDKIEVLDYLNTEVGGNKGTTIQALTNEHKIWQYTQLCSKPCNVKLLMADKTFIVNSICTYHVLKGVNDMTTSIQILSSMGAKVSEVALYKNPDVSIYPISAEIKKDHIEVLSQFTHHAHEYSKVKYGICIHEIDFTGKIISQKYNEITQTMAKDSVMKRYKLMVNSYLYLHNAVKLKNGHWLVAAEQLIRTRLRIRPFKNPTVTFNKKNICLMELDEDALVVKMHVEPNKDDGVRVPHKYYRRPQNGAMIADQKNRMDINYFVSDGKPDEHISYVFTDYNYHTKKLSLGNLLYKNGEFKVDRFIIPTKTSLTRIGIFPARYGHVLLIRYDPSFGLLDFDTIKFNN